MSREADLRRNPFLVGTGIRLGDGREWIVPGPLEDATDPDYEALLRGVLEAEDAPERHRAELALTIGLLRRNYHLTTDDYDRLLDGGSDVPASRAVQAAMHAVAVAHLDSYLSRRASSTLPPPHSSWQHRPGWLSRAFSGPFRRGVRTMS